jgi:hypothetical protein
MKTMTQNQFVALCEQHLVDPAIALENENVVKALNDRNDQEVERLLTEEF